MDTSSTTYNRVRRSTAGISRRYDEQDYVLVSFPHVNKHSILPVASINVDPLDKQNGCIKTFGSRKNLRIISSGSKEVIKERASRYAVSAGSEEIEIIPDEQENDENKDKDDDEYSPPMHRTIKENKRRVMIGEQSKSPTEIISSNINEQTTTTSNYECSESTSLSRKNPLSHRQLNFNRVYSPKTGTKRMHEDNFDESSISGSNATDDECDKDLHVMEKNNELRSLLKKSRRKRKRKAVEPVTKVEGPCSGCEKLQEEVVQLQQRVGRLEKVIPVIKKFRSKQPLTPINQTNSIGDGNEIYANIERVTGINPNQIKSTPTRPTMVMRELIKKGGHIGDKTYLTKHENLFKEFIQMKCMILDDNLKAVWEEITSSLSRQHIDIENNMKKKIHKEPPLVLANTTSQLAQTSTIVTEQEATSLASTSTIDNEQETTGIVTSQSSESM